MDFGEIIQEYRDWYNYIEKKTEIKCVKIRGSTKFNKIFFNSGIFPIHVKINKF